VGAIVSAVLTYFVTRKLERSKAGDERRWKGREKVSEKLAVIFSDYTLEKTKNLQDVELLRAQWAPEGYLFDLLHDEGLGRELTNIVTGYLGGLQQFINRNITRDVIDSQRGAAWRTARDRLESFAPTPKK
jgi:hypothetical protein